MHDAQCGNNVEMIIGRAIIYYHIYNKEIYEAQNFYVSKRNQQQNIMLVNNIHKVGYCTQKNTP